MAIAGHCAFRKAGLALTVSALALLAFAPAALAQSASDSPGVIVPLPPEIAPTSDAPAAATPRDNVSTIRAATGAGKSEPEKKPEALQRSAAPAPKMEPTAPVQGSASNATAAPAQNAVAEPPQLPPVAHALKETFAAALAQPIPRDVRGRAAREEMKALADFYEARGFEPVWRMGANWGPAAASTIARLQKAGEDALDASAWRAPALTSADDASIAAADLALSQAALAYGQQASGGRIRPSSLSGLITAKPVVATAAEVLGKVAGAGGNAGDVLRGFNPQHDGYRALRAKLAEMRGPRQPVQDTPVAIAPGPMLRVGMSDQRVPLIRARFGLTPNEHVTDPLVYDTRVAGAVAEFQRSKGIRASGILTPQTVAALSGAAAESSTRAIEAEIIANMERWRWLPRDLGKMHILVNIPEFMVRVFRDEQRIHETRVIVGATKTPSPVFSHRMQFLIVNPSWHVPPSIIKESGGPERMAAKGFEVRQTRSGVAVRQPPGPRNALGYIKFMFPNDHAVYLHDTPGRHLFSAAMRAMSHGCIRVHEPFKLAEVLMSTAPGWSEKRLRSMIGSGERTVPLPEHLPVHIAYFTTFVDENGQLQQRPDIYGHSRKVIAALGLR